MSPLFMTAYTGRILGPIAKGLGEILNYIYVFLAETLHIESIAIAIIILTIFIYLLLLPLTYRQQKFSILNRKMTPELQKIQKKYKGKKDQQSMMAQQEETRALYDKYGVSPTGSCVQMFIQLPILYALFYVFRNIPAYIDSVKNVFSDLVDGIVATKGYEKIMTDIYENSGITRIKVDFTTQNIDEKKDYVIDVLYKLSENDWNTLREKFTSLGSLIDQTQSNLQDINYFFILNISDTPWNIIKASFAAGTFGLLIAALLIPICSWLSQMLNLRLMPTAAGNDQMARQMRTMNLMMPLISLIFTFSVPIGLGLYWIVGALFRSLLQVIFNKHFEKIDLDKIVEKNKEKAQKKQEKRKNRPTASNKESNAPSQASIYQRAKIDTNKQKALDAAAEARKSAPPDSIAAKADLVKNFNNRNSKK